MNDQTSNPDVPLSGDPLSPARPVLSAEALARRRLLLKGAVGSAAAVAALQPVGALATGQSTVLTCLGDKGKEGLCSISGVQSAAHSFGPNIVAIQAKGKPMSHWSAATYNDSTKVWTPVNAWTEISHSKTAGSAFGSTCASTLSSKTLLAVLRDNSTTVEATYICAYLNAAVLYADTPSSTKTFPYSKEKVYEFWSAGGDTRAAAASLFQRITPLS